LSRRYRQGGTGETQGKALEPSYRELDGNDELETVKAWNTFWIRLWE
jgi:hypothetical protein